ncbi:bifunctional hydroxymethylpyrimidine kinase/phosphomethylpyrimidine kinase [Parapedobacter sp. ISTM3]|uniref:hydroxymethylpyrimidine kinase n=1 Tax=Parapedobacter luteus TaxID=623280 RepID=A0A1T5AN25_9SPHI|nr:MULTISPECIES: bifunctional hydroxymethylpyrimidine kinase/phosphomethylpyrimidine kinase [Parapedobacter]MBK1441906.1 bifunctional hydroxymethylpyrimidine kinase/phosphomethylpyrimidine kinase [Parapedobacter sp. ISTM3]SKB36414.1 hydroxymethylpyrimidine/phosphomethylpyrimidine kinase [Parapedobacter luteus]
MNTKTYRYPSVLTIAGFDGSGGAGIQADIKTISALGCYATSALTALPVQNTQGVKAIYPIPYHTVQDQLVTILDDIFPDAIKIGMVHTGELVDTIVDTLAEYAQTPVVFDPVMVATSGDKLIEDKTITTIVERLFPMAAVITPNMDEAAILAEMPVRTLDDLYVAGLKIRKLGCQSVLLKGGHLDAPRLTSLYFDAQGTVHEFGFTKSETNNTHGSGCTLSSAIASYIALRNSLLEAVRKGQEYVYQAILHGSDVQVGKGNGPLNHFFNPQKLTKYDLV